MADAHEPEYGDLYELTLWFDSRDPKQLRRVAWVHACDVCEQVHIVDAATPDSPIKALRLNTRDGERLTGYLLFERLVRTLRLLWPIALITWIPGIAPFARARYGGELTTHGTPAASCEEELLESKEAVQPAAPVPFEKS
jgi:hypothetical protein